MDAAFTFYKMKAVASLSSSSSVKPLSCEEVVVQLTPLLETQSVDMTAAAEAATQASDEIALAVTAVTSARLRLLRLQPRWNSRKQQRTLSPVREGAVIIEDALSRVL